MKITKAVIPAAGFGTRVLPATKNIPKEMYCNKHSSILILLTLGVAITEIPTAQLLSDKFSDVSV